MKENSIEDLKNKNAKLQAHNKSLLEQLEEAEKVKRILIAGGFLSELKYEEATTFINSL